jgi:multidrug efflux system membrane fusion protein
MAQELEPGGFAGMMSAEKHKYILLMGLMLALLLTLGSGCSKKKTEERPAVPVQVQSLTEYTGTEESRYSANIIPATTVPLAFKVGGYVDSLAKFSSPDGRLRDIQEGDKVTRGMVLARLRKSDYQTKINQAQSLVTQAEAGVEASKAQVAQAQAGFEKATKDFKRAQSLYESQSLTKPDYDAAQAQLDAAAARLEEAQAGLAVAKGKVVGAKAQLQEAKIALNDSNLSSPLTGVVIKKMIEQGSLVGPGTPGFVLAETATMKAVFGVPDSLVQALRLGQTQTILTESLPRQSFQGKITQISPAADPSSRVFDVEISIPNLKGLLKAGMIATVNLATGEKPATPPLVIPLSAVVRAKDNPNGYAVYLLEVDGEKTIARYHEVTLGETYGNMIAVTGGLTKDDKVITSGATIVHDGDRVQVRP